MSEQPLAVLERLAEIEREHAKAGPAWATYCQLEGGLWPCDAIQLARAVRALVDLLSESAPYVKWASIYDVSGYSDCSPDLLERIKSLFDLLADAAPSREEDA